MKRFVAQSLVLAFVAGTAALTTPACVDNESSLYIQGVLAPAAGDCSFTPSAAATLFLRGRLDVAFKNEYKAALLVGSQITTRVNRNELRTETSKVRLEGVEVSLVDSADAEIVPAFTVPVAGFIEAAQTVASFGAVEALLVPEKAGQKLTTLLNGDKTAVKRVIAKARVYGHTLGGVDVQSGEFQWPIDVCYGCSILLNPDPATGAVCSRDSGNVGSGDPTTCFTWAQEAGVPCAFCPNLSKDPNICPQ